MRGEELTPWLIRYAYGQGAFPMTTEGEEIEWFLPEMRCLFPLDGIHISSSLAKTIRKGTFEIRFDTDFEGVIRGCFRPDPDDNWLSEHFVRAYTQAHFEGWAHCVEAWHEGKLVGGAYGVAIGTCFCAESMFHRMPDASKVALAALVPRCRELGFTIFDAQIINSHTRSLGAYEVPARVYTRMLKEALKGTTPWSKP
ncbi:leucyl/phenylalanyl-tRNA--protein transferase [bacterium]|nr:MAG: leucyl/phenylalanyl-tRNA--protein transferase [bacterium]